MRRVPRRGARPHPGRHRRPHAEQRRELARAPDQRLAVTALDPVDVARPAVSEVCGPGVGAGSVAGWFNVAMARVVVQVDQDHLSGLLRGPRVGLAELVWNAVDADATVVDITVEVNDLGGVEAVSIADDGHGILADEVIQDFQALGGSWKKVQKLSRVERRRLHGQHGRGRFSAFGVGAGVRWRTVSAGAEAGQLIEIRGRADSLNEFDISEPVAVTEETGTTVHISQLSEASSKYLEKQAVADDLTTEFAIYLEEYPSIQIRWRGTPLAPSQLQDSRESYVLDVPEGQPQATL